MTSQRRETDSSTIVEEMIAGFEELADDLRGLSADAVKTKYRRRTVQAKLAPSDYDAAAVKRVRTALDCSQQAFANFIGVSTSTLQRWEKGARPVSSVAARLFDEMRLNPDYWRIRLRQFDQPRQAG